MYQYVDSIPVASLALPSEVAKATSKSPAITNSIQFIYFYVLVLMFYFENSFKIFIAFSVSSTSTKI